MIHIIWFESDVTETASLNAALARLLSTLIRPGAQPSARVSELPVHIEGTQISTFTGEGDDFEKLVTFYFDNGPAFWKKENNLKVVLKILESHLELDRPLEVVAVDEPQMFLAVYNVLEKELTGEAARTFLEANLK